MSDAYARSGVDTGDAGRAVSALVGVLREIDPGRESRIVPLPGHFASVIEIAPGLGLALCTDGVGSKVIVAELAERFDVSEDEVVRDLNLVMCCGVPPYGADQLVSVVLDEDGSVLAWKGPFFNRPMRLTPAEGLAVIAAGRALLAVPGA